MDLGSANGTLVNGEVIEPHVPAVLRDGDQVLLGETLVHYTAPPSLAEPSPRVAARARPKSRQLGAPRREGLVSALPAARNSNPRGGLLVRASVRCAGGSGGGSIGGG